MFCLLYNLKIKQEVESAIIGRLINNKLKNSKKSLLCKIDANNIPPKNVLPVSPINIDAGDQLNTKNPNKEKVIINVKLFWVNPIYKNVNARQLETNPSIPSIKLIKLISPIPKNKRTKKIMGIKSWGRLIEFKK